MGTLVRAATVVAGVCDRAFDGRVRGAAGAAGGFTFGSGFTAGKGSSSAGPSERKHYI